jgi:hypothetical protein
VLELDQVSEESKEKMRQAALAQKEERSKKMKEIWAQRRAEEEQ